MDKAYEITEPESEEPESDGGESNAEPLLQSYELTGPMAIAALHPPDTPNTGSGKGKEKGVDSTRKRRDTPIVVLMTLSSYIVGNNAANFLKGLTVEHVEEAIQEFDEVLKISNKSLTSSSFEKTSDQCSTFLTSIVEKPVDKETAKLIPQFWAELKDVYDISLYSSLTTRATRALYMLTSWSTMDWITLTIADGLKGKHQDTWVALLLNDVKMTIQKAHRLGIHGYGTLLPIKYFDNLEDADPYIFKIPRLIMDKRAQDKSIAKVASNALKEWLKFPTTPSTIAQNALVGTLLKCGSRAILYLPKVWDMFRHPYAHVIHPPTIRLKPTQQRTQAALKEFDDIFKDHPLMDPHSLAGTRLSQLDDLILNGKWGSVSRPRKATAGSSSNASSMVSKPSADLAFFLKKIAATQVEESIIAPYNWEDFNHFLVFFQPLLEDGITKHLSSADLLKGKIANKPDYLLPFRSKAPTFQNMLNLIASMSVKPTLEDPAVLFNVAAFRGAFFGSNYALKELRWFKNIQEWTLFSEASDHGEDFFVNKSAYGSYQTKRHSSHLAAYWEVACSGWHNHLTKNTDRDIKKLFDFFVAELPFVGKLAALLMVGDLAELGLVDMPQPEVMGDLIADVNAGATKGLQILGLINSSNQSISLAFQQLHSDMEQHLTEDRKTLMGYSVVMLEHSLCKYQRILRSKQAGKQFKR